MALAALRDAYREFLDHSDPLADAPTYRFLELSLREKEKQIATLTAWAAQESARDLANRTRTEDWIAGFSNQLAFLGGIGTDAAPPDVEVASLPGSQSVSVPDLPARDPRYWSCRFYWPDIIDAEFPYGDGSHQHPTPKSRRMQLADRITILRDGRLVDTAGRQNFSIPHLIQKMVGREVNHLFHREPLREPDRARSLVVSKLNDRGLLSDISFDLHVGEILGIGGLPGSGKDELVECLSGTRAFTGNVAIDGRQVRIRSTEDVIRAGMALVPSDRRSAGAFQVLSILDNLAAASLHKVSCWGILRPKLMKELANTYLSRMNLKARSIEQKIGTLSGGNQQKVVLARGLATEPRVLLLHEPTRGIDVGAKAEIYQILNQLAARGIAILIVSSELPELIGQCDRIFAMHDGRISGEFSRLEANEERILANAMGHGDQPVSDRIVQ